LSFQVRTFAVLLLVALASYTVAGEETPTWNPPSLETLPEQWAGLSFDAFVDEAVRTYLLYNPLLLTTEGLCDALGVRNDRLPEAGPSHFADMARLADIALEQLERYERDRFSLEDRMTYDVLHEEFCGMRQASEAWCSFWLSVNPSTACNLFAVTRILYEDHPAVTTDDLDDYIVRLWGFEGMIAGMIEEIETAVAAGVVLSTASITEDLLRDWLIAYTQEDGNGFYNVGLYKLSSVPGASPTYEASYVARLETAIREAVAPAFARLVDCLERVAGDLAGDGSVPDWQASAYWPDYYAALLRGSLGMTVDPADVHARAKAEAERLRTELCALSENPAAVNESTYVVLEELSSIEYACGRYYIDADRLEDARAWYEAAGDWATELFDTLPDGDPEIRVAYVQRVQYDPETFDGSVPSAFIIPFRATVAPYVLPSLVFHETIPGHHLQIARSRMENVCLLQQLTTWKGFAEGWAMYAEQLAMEQGWHDGNLCGLLGYYHNQLLVTTMTVVETGLFALGWTEDEARAYAEAMVPRSPYAFDSQLSYLRYMPVGNTLYFVGLTEFLDQRQRAMDALGDAFDLCGFHEAVLAHGNVPLRSLTTIVDAYIDSALQPTTSD